MDPREEGCHNKKAEPEGQSIRKSYNFTKN
jgi:hypothetical protein